MSLAFEYLRGIIEGSGHRWTFSRILTTIIMLAAFELYIISIHDSFSLQANTFVSVAGYIFGNQFGDYVGRWINLLALGGLWIWVALIIVFKLRKFIIGWPYPSSNPEPGGTLRQYLSHMRPDLWRGAKAGLWAGLFWAPLTAVVYVIAIRAYFIAASIHDKIITPDALLAGAPKLPSGGLGTWLNILLYGPSTLAAKGAEHFGPIGLIIGIVVATAIASALVSKENRPLAVVWPTMAVVLGLALPIFLTKNSRLDLYYLLLMSAVIWGIPATFLGLLAPLLRRPGHHPPVWGLVASAAAGIMALVTAARFYSGTNLPERLLLIGSTLLLLVLAFSLFRGAWTEELWLCVALSIGMMVWGTTSLMQFVNLLNMQKRAHSLIAVRLTPTAPVGSFDKQGAEFRESLIIPLTMYQARAIPCAGDDSKKKSATYIFNVDNAKCLEEFDRDSKAALANAQAPAPIPETQPAQILRLSERIAEIEKVEARVEGSQDSATANSCDASSTSGWPGKLDPALDDLLKDLRLALVASSDLTIASVTSNTVMPDLEKDRASVVQQVAADFSALEQERKDLEANRDSLQLAQAEHLELTMTSSLGFWVTIGLLAIWRLTRPDPD
jgi:hypothetical protein